MQGMDEDVRAKLRGHGIRNALLTSIAPTGTISLYAGNVSSGIEPVLLMPIRANAAKRRITQRRSCGLRRANVARQIRDADLPDYFVNAQTWPKDHVKMQAAAQNGWILNLENHNCPEDISFEAFKKSIARLMKAAVKAARPIAPTR